MIPGFLNKCDLILLMTVHPGFGGQAFMPEVLEKIRYTRDAIDKLKIRKGGVVDSQGSSSTAPFNIQVDGGIDDQSAKACYEAGANVFVSGTYLFGAPDMKKRIETLRGFKR